MNLQSDNIYVVLFSFWLTIGGGEIRQVQRWDDAEEAEEEFLNRSKRMRFAVEWEKEKKLFLLVQHWNNNFVALSTFHL